MWVASKFLFLVASGASSDSWILLPAAPICREATLLSKSPTAGKEEFRSPASSWSFNLFKNSISLPCLDSCLRTITNYLVHSISNLRRCKHETFLLYLTFLPVHSTTSIDDCNRDDEVGTYTKTRARLALRDRWGSWASRNGWFKHRCPLSWCNKILGDLYFDLVWSWPCNPVVLMWP